MLKPPVPPPLSVTWEMKDVSSAATSIEQLDDGRLECRIDHELIEGVTPEMLVWWFQSFPFSHLEHDGQLVPLYRIWHPRDHIRFSVRTMARDRSPGVSRGARVLIVERLGPQVTSTRARVAQMDDGGLHLVVRRLGVKIGELRHTFEATPRGTLYKSRLVVGSSLPLIGTLVNWLARKRLFPREVAEGWVKHNVEEVGNFQFFLPKLYAQRSQAHLG